MVTGVDLRFQNIRLCNLLARENPDFKVNFVESSLEDFIPRIQADEYDLVLCFSVLHWLTKEHGFAPVQELLTHLAKTIDVGLFELALTKAFPEHNLPPDCYDFFKGYSFARALAYYEWSEGRKFDRRPFLFASSKFAYFEKFGMMKIDSVIYNPLHDVTISYRCGDKFVKIFYAKNNEEFSDAQREIDILKDLGGQNGIPRLHLAIGEQDEMGARFLIVRDFIAGITLKEKVERGEDFDRWSVIKQVLEWLLWFDEQGYYHGDVHIRNIIYDDNGRCYLVDYEKSRNASELTSVGNVYVKLKFFRFMNSVLSPDFPSDFLYSIMTQTHLKPGLLVFLRESLTSWQYEQILAIKESENFFTRLYAILFNPAQEKAPINIGEFENLAMGVYLQQIGMRFVEQSERVERLEKEVAEQQRRIERLEKIVNELK